MNNMQLLKEEFISFEDSLLNGNSPVKYPAEYSILSNQSKTALDFYRHNYYAYIKVNIEKEYLLVDFSNIIQELGNTDRTKLDEVLAMLSTENISSKYHERTKNSYNMQNEILPTQKVTNTLLLLYLNKFENDEVLMVLSSLLDIIKGKKLDAYLKKFRDNNGRLVKGKVVNYINNGYSSFPNVHDAIRTAYRPHLRNIIGHNNYTIDPTNELIISMEDQEMKISKEEFFESLYLIQELHNCIQWVMSNFELMKSHNSLYKDGVIESASGYTKDEKPILILYQLWCFFDLSKNKPDFSSEISMYEKNNKFIIKAGSYEGKTPVEFMPYWIHDVKEKKTQVVVCSIVPLLLGEDENAVFLEPGDFKIIDEYQLENISWEK